MFSLKLLKERLFEVLKDVLIAVELNEDTDVPYINVVFTDSLIPEIETVADVVLTLDEIVVLFGVFGAVLSDTLRLTMYRLVFPDASVTLKLI